MADVFRIMDRFNITGRGTVYMLQMSKGANLRIGDSLSDLHGNAFKVTAIEMMSRCGNYMISIEDLPIGILFELISGVEAEGNILVRSLSDVNFLFCNHPLYPRRVDEDYEQEYQAAGLHHACALFSYEDMEAGKLSLYGEDIQGLTIYRGWMMSPEMYRRFYEALESRGIILINNSEEYERYHLLPGWYPDFAEWTAESIWENEGSLDTIMKMTRDLQGAYIVKDFVKSRKHEWYDACFIPNISDKVNAGKIIGNFIERQGDFLTGGVVLRRFVDLNSIGYHEQSGMPISEEYRVFVYAGRVFIIDDYWMERTEIDITDEEREWIQSIAAKVRSNFVTIDVARKTDGTLVIMELGDGQVSGLQQIEADVFYKGFRGGGKLFY